MKQIINTGLGPFECRLLGNPLGPALLALNGGHTHCGSPVKNAPLFEELGFHVIIPSRPGYGQTPSATGRSAEEAADALAALLDALGHQKATVLGISAAGRTALQLAGRHPDRVDKLILQGALTHDKWIDMRWAFLIYLFFNPVTEGAFWSFYRFTLTRWPRKALSMMLQELTTLDAKQIVAAMSPEELRETVEFLLPSRSGSGFLNDIKHTSGDLSRIQAPTLIMHSRNDGANPFDLHALYALEHIPHAELYEVDSESHLMWIGRARHEIEAKLRAFILAPPCGETRATS